jgi:hypothetical protein
VKDSDTKVTAHAERTLPADIAASATGGGCMNTRRTAKPAFESSAFVAFVLILLVGMLEGTVYAQAVASVGGIVTDDTGARLPGVVVTVRNQATGRVQTLTTATDGVYHAVALPPGPYELTAELTGFRPVKQTIDLTVGAAATMDFKLAVAAVEEAVIVSGVTPTVEVAKSELSSVVLSDQVSTLPSINRSFLELAQLLPGSAPDNSRVQFFNPTKFGGSADQRNGWSMVIDGGDLDDVIWGSTTTNFTQEAVQEFRVLRNQFDTEYGSALNSVVSVLSKSGTNVYKGSGFYFGRDAALNATPFFATTKPPFSQQRYGGSLGGPIAQNKTHFFGAYEFSKINTSKIIALPPSNPFAAAENGVFPSGGHENLFDVKVDHRLNDSHSFFVRYAYDSQSLQRTQNVTSDSNQIDEFSRTNTVVVQEDWLVSKRMVNTLRYHFYHQNVGNSVYSTDVGIVRPSVTTGQPPFFPQAFPRTKSTVYDTLYFNTGPHSLKFGGDLAFLNADFDSHRLEHGQFTFTTDAPFNENDPTTWPFSLAIQAPGVRNYKTKEVTLFTQDDWRVHDRLHVNLGLRYDIDTNLRNNDFYYGLLTDPAWAGIENFISTDRGNDWSAIQPRVGATWDLRGDGTVVLRGGFGRYVTRNRPWFDQRSMDSIVGNLILIQDPQALRFYPDINKVLGGKPLDEFAISSGSRSPLLLANDFRLPYSLNTTAGVGWQINSRTSLEVDYIHDSAARQIGQFDQNLPPSGPISPTNPRPVAGYGVVGVLENFVTSSYNAFETQFQKRFRGLDTVLISYTWSRSIIDGGWFFDSFRGTQRTPHELGFNDTDQRHNLTISATTRIPGDFQVSGILKAISGSPMYVQSGLDLDGDGTIQGDRPMGLPSRVGRSDVDQSLTIINDFRTSLGLAPIPRSLLNLDPFLSLDARITKIFRVGGSRQLQAFLEGYNLTNHENFTPYTLNPSMNAPDFLVRNSARDARQIQWGARFEF